MRTLRATHTTDLRYEGEATESVNQAWLLPVDTSRQSVLSAEIRTIPESELVEHSDVYGNRVVWFQITSLHETMVVEARAEVAVRPPEVHAEPGWAVIEDPAHADLCAEFLAPSTHVRWPASVASLAEELQLDEGAGVLAWLAQLEKQLNEKIVYSPGSTGVETPVEDVVHVRRGVCQDLAHVGIAICRLRGLPARYVSGWLYGAGASGPGESHAWLEAHAGPAGWIEIDPTHPGMQYENYVRVAIGRDYADVPPVRGSYVGPPTAEMDVRVIIDDIEG